MNKIKRNLLSLLSLAAMIAVSIYLYDSLPDQIPSCYDCLGPTQDTQPKQVMAVLLPLIYLGVILLVNVLVRISPQKFSMPNSKRAMDIILSAIGVLFFFLHLALLLANGDITIFITYFSYGMAAFLIFTGNVFGKTERNFFIGIRLPWTIASNANWKATHRLAGKLMVVFGIVLLVSNTLMPSLALMLALSLGPLLIPVLYSPCYYFKYEKNEKYEEDTQPQE